MPLDRRNGIGPRYAVGLYQVSTAEQGKSGLGLETQRASVLAFVACQGSERSFKTDAARRDWSYRGAA